MLLVVMTCIALIGARDNPMVFVGLLGVAAVTYLVALFFIGRQTADSSRALVVCLVLGLVWRAILITAAPLVSDDVYRYIWDGRIQQFGYNPYLWAPEDPALAHLHNAETEKIHPTSAHLPTIYPPAAQVFFRGVTTVDSSVSMMVTAIVIADVLTSLVLWRWLVYQRRSAWWVLAYAWHPLVALEGAGGGHVDVLGTLFLVTAAYALSRNWSATAGLALAGSISVKFLPIILLPLFWYRMNRWAFVLGVGLVVLLYFPFSEGLAPPIGSLPVYLEQWRFNGPLFAWIERLIGTVSAMVLAIGCGVAVAVVARLRLPRDSAGAWAWPMATTLCLMPVVYPWYLVWLTPFLSTVGTWPLTVWTLGSLATYVVWASELSGLGWVLPVWVQPLEYGLAIIAGLGSWVLARRRLGRISA